MICPVPPSTVRSVRPCREYRGSFLAALSAYRAANERLYVVMYAPAEDDFDAFVHRLAQEEAGLELVEGGVPCSHRWLVTPEGEVVGNLRVRHQLSWMNELSGGHIGYDVPPPYRGRGYGSLCLTHALATAREIGLERVLVTCTSGNFLSRQIILNHGGEFEREIETVHEGLIHRFWITL